MPFALRLFGSKLPRRPLLCPGLGRAFVATRNFDDVVLIKTVEGHHYLITPSHPDEFTRAVI